VRQGLLRSRRRYLRMRRVILRSRQGFLRWRRVFLRTRRGLLRPVYQIAAFLQKPRAGDRAVDSRPCITDAPSVSMDNPNRGVNEPRQEKAERAEERISAY